MVEENKDLHKYLEENNLEIKFEIDFPMYKILPDEVQLALKILRKHGMALQVYSVEKETRQE